MSEHLFWNGKNYYTINENLSTVNINENYYFLAKPTLIGTSTQSYSKVGIRFDYNYKQTVPNAIYNVILKDSNKKIIFMTGIMKTVQKHSSDLYPEATKKFGNNGTVDINTGFNSDNSKIIMIDFYIPNLFELGHSYTAELYGIDLE